MRGVLVALRDQAVRVFRDPGALLILVGAVTIYAFFYPIPYLPEVLKRVPVVVVDLDRSALSRRLIRMVDAHDLVSVARQVPELAVAERLGREGDAGGILVIPEGLERDVRRGARGTVGAYLDASYFLVYRQVLTGLSEATGTLSAGIEIARLRSQGMSDAQARAARDPLPLVTRPLFNATEGYATYVVPPVLVLILQQTLLIGIGLLGGTEREIGQAAPATPAGPLATVLGRAVFFVGLYAVHAVFYFGVVFRIYGFGQALSGWTLALFTAPFLLSVTLLGLAVGELFPRRETAIQTLLFTSLPAVFLASFSWPPEAIPSWLRVAAQVLPSTSGMPGILRITQMGASLAQVWTEWMTLWGLSAAYLLLAWAVFRWRSRPGVAAS